MRYKTIVLILITCVYFFDLLLELVRWHSAKNPIPANVSDIYDPESYRKWKSYHGANCRFGILQRTAVFAIDFLLILFNLFARFAGLFPQTPFMQLFAVLLLSSAAGLLMIPFSYYNTMVLEEKYGFNRTTKKTFWMDQLKSFVIGLILIVGIGILLMWIHLTLGTWLIMVFAAIMTLVALAVAFLFPIFSKIFNQFTPLAEGELREKLTGLLEKHGYRVRGIQVMDASRRTSKSNAYFTGFGKMKTIVLYDTLIQAMTPEEICAVFAHELGHGLHRDTLKNQLLSFLQMLMIAALAWLTLQKADIFLPFGFGSINYGFALLLIMNVEFALISPLFGLLTNALSRRAEYRADAQAVAEGYGSELIRALKKLAKENFSDLSPDPLLVKLEYSHPALSQRIRAIERLLQ